MKKRISLLIVIMLLSFILYGCAASDSKPSKAFTDNTRIITDMLGRKVEIPENIESIVCTGAGALRMICYAQADDLVIGVEDIDKKKDIRRAYNYVYYDSFKDLPSIGKGGGRGYTAYEEEIISLNPDVIFSAYTSDALEELENRTGIPVISITYQSDMFDPDLLKSLELIGDVLGKEKRCAEVISYIKDAQADLDKRTKNIPDRDKPTAYAGAISFRGGHGFGGTYGNFTPFTAINAINVADMSGKEGAFDVDLEKVLVWDPDYIFLDPGNMGLVNEEYEKNPNYFKSLRAVNEGNVYSMISYNNYTTNIEIAIAGSYYAGKILFPEQFSDIDIAKKTDELLEKFLGKPFYSDMVEAGLVYGEIEIGS